MVVKGNLLDVPASRGLSDCVEYNGSDFRRADISGFGGAGASVVARRTFGT
jgi:hypothetical protein